MSAVATHSATSPFRLAAPGKMLTRHRTRSVRRRLPPVSAAMLRAFSAYSRWFIGRNFHSVRISLAGLPPVWRPISSQSPKHGNRTGPAEGVISDLPVVVYVNHASWWDPLICLLLQNEFFGGRRAFAPIDARALEQYRFFQHLGFFGVRQNSPSGAADFLRTATGILSEPGTVLWLTPQGRFSDVRERPLQFKPGLGHLPGRVELAAFVPLAIEYSHWEERKPEVLCRFGPTTIAGRYEGPVSTTSGDWTRHFEGQLAVTQDALATEVQRRRRADFNTLLETGSGVGLIYDAWRAFRARITGKSFHREHGHL